MKTFVDIRDVIVGIYTRKIEKENKDDQKADSDKSSSPLVRQIYAACGPLLLTIGVGAVLGYSAILLPQLQPVRDRTNSTTLQENNIQYFTINQNEASWIASMAALPMAVSTLIGGWLTEKHGRRKTHIVACIPKIAGWTLIFLSKNVVFLVIGRTLTGVSAGILATATAIYLGEISHPMYRGFFLGALSLAVATGLFLVHLTGTFLSWQNTALLNVLLPIISVVLIYPTPESPSWLVKKGKKNEARDSFIWLRGSKEDNEFEDILKTNEDQTKDNLVDISLRQTITGLFKPEFLKPLTVIVVFFIVSQWSGPSAITFYTVNIVKQTLGNGINEYLATILIDFIRVVFSVIACLLMRHFSRRPLAIISGIGTTLSLLVLSGYTYIIKFFPSTSNYFYIPAIALVTYIIFISIGYVSLPWALIGEILPLKYRSLGSGISAFSAFIAAFAVVKTSPEMFEKLGAEGTFLCYGTVSLVGLIFLCFCLPETKGKTLQEIEQEYVKKV